MSQVTAIASLVLPGITGLSLGQVGGLARLGKGRDRFAMAVFTILVVYYTVIITLSLTHMVPPNDLNCHLDQQWQSLFHNKDQMAIKRIQNAHHCCGLHGVKDRAWPFPDEIHKNDTCSTAFGRNISCFGVWRRDEQIIAGLVLLVAVVSALMNVGGL